MIDELFDRHARRELGKAADMIRVIVRRDQMIDLRDAGVPGRGHDAIGVTDRGGADVSRVDEDRLA